MRRLKQVSIFSILFCDSCKGSYQERWLKKNISPLSQRGIVLKKYLDPEQKDLQVYLLNDGNTYLFLNDSAYQLTEIGDSIIKNSGTLMYRLKKKKGMTHEFYPGFMEKDIKDSDVNDL